MESYKDIRMRIKNVKNPIYGIVMAMADDIIKGCGVNKKVEPGEYVLFYEYVEVLIKLVEAESIKGKKIGRLSKENKELLHSLQEKINLINISEICYMVDMDMAEKIEDWEPTNLLLAAGSFARAATIIQARGKIGRLRLWLLRKLKGSV